MDKHDIEQNGVVDTDQTALTRQRYDRIAPVYDVVEAGMELFFRRWRKQLWRTVSGADILEIGVGTGKNIPFYPSHSRVIALDISEAMLARARQRAKRHSSHVRLLVGDAQLLPFPDDRFDQVVATFVFCSVPDPILGLKEILRVLKPGGQFLAVEHVLTHVPVLRRLMQWLDPVPAHMWGAHINRDTVGNVRRAGFSDIVQEELWLDIVKRISARAPA